jgi:16S rRNA C1402 (ribose-2'-O) methylase RsmI
MLVSEKTVTREVNSPVESIILSEMWALMSESESNRSEILTIVSGNRKKRAKSASL